MGTANNSAKKKTIGRYAATAVELMSAELPGVLANTPPIAATV